MSLHSFAFAFAGPLQLQRCQSSIDVHSRVRVFVKLVPLFGAFRAMSGRLWLWNATYELFMADIYIQPMSEKAWQKYMRRRWRDYCSQLQISTDGVDLSAWSWPRCGPAGMYSDVALAHLWRE